MVDVTIEFEDVAVPIPVMTRLSQPDRDAVISDREAAIKIYQQPYRDFLKGQLGAVTQTPLWIINALQVQMKAGDVIGIVDTWPDVINITVSHSNITPETTGTVFRQGTGIADLRALGLSTPWWGLLGVIDSTPLDTSHPTYSSRVERYVDCNSCLENFIGICYRWGCADATGVPTPDSNTYASHASDMVYRVIGGNGPTGSADGGALQDAEVRVYKIANTDAVASALQNAVSVGARAVDMSLSLDLTPGDGCARNTDYSGLNSIIRRAVHTGTIFVKSAGNDGNDPRHRILWPMLLLCTATACALTDEVAVQANRVDTTEQCYWPPEIVGHSPRTTIAVDQRTIAVDPTTNTIWLFQSRTHAETLGFEVCGAANCGDHATPDSVDGLEPCPNDE